jgi:SulP family sulfate permease
LKKNIPAALILVLLGIIITWSAELGTTANLDILGEVPSGLPRLVLPTLDLELLRDLFPSALVLSLISFILSVSVASKFAVQFNYELNSNQEFIALGLSNFVASMFQAYPISGALARTAVNVQAGAKTQVSTLVTVVVIGATLLFLTPVIFFLPKAILAGIIFIAAISLIDLTVCFLRFVLVLLVLPLVLLPVFLTLLHGL